MKRTRAWRRHMDWTHAIRKKNKSSWYCTIHPWYDNLHEYSKNKIHCSCPLCSAKTNNKHRCYWGSFYNPTMQDKRKDMRMDELETEFFNTET